MRVPTFARPIGGLVALAVCGCAADSTVVENLMVVPSYYDTLECPDLTAQFQGASQRLKELTVLREKAGQDPGGVVANALAYNTEYARAEAMKKYSEAAANRKGCDLTKKPPVTAKPKPDASMGPRRRGEHPQPPLGGISQ